MSPILNVSLTLLLASSLVLPQTGYAQLQAGTARVNITPPLGGPMYGYSARGANVSEGVHDSLYARALMLDDGSQKLAIVTLDLGAVSAENTANINALISEHIEVAQILLIASHTHSGPRNVPDFPSESDAWIREAEQRIAGAVIEANRHLVPVRIGVGRGEVRQCHNRRLVRPDGDMFMLWGNRDRLPTEPIDYELGVIRIQGPDGPVATLVNLACHPVVLGPDNLHISADYPGPMTRVVESEIGGQVMYLPGAAGDINPYWDKTPVAEGGFGQVEQMGQAVAEEVLRVSNRISEYIAEPRFSIRTETIALAHRDDPARIERNLHAEINTILIGENLALATFPGEFFVEHGLTLKSESPFEHTFFIGYTNDALNYFPTIRAVTEGGYGAASATRVEVGAGERLVNRALINLLYQGDKISP